MLDREYPDATLETVVRLFWRQGVASTGMQDVVAATGLNQSSLYATLAASRGLPAVSEFFAGLIVARCSGEYARWGCMASNAHDGAENSDPDVRAVLDQHHRELRDAMYAALVAAMTQSQLAPGADPGASADLPALLAHGVNLRSRAGADAAILHRTVATALDSIADRAATWAVGGSAFQQGLGAGAVAGQSAPGISFAELAAGRPVAGAPSVVAGRHRDHDLAGLGAALLDVRHRFERLVGGEGAVDDRAELSAVVKGRVRGAGSRWPA